MFKQRAKTSCLISSSSHALAFTVCYISLIQRVKITTEVGTCVRISHLAKSPEMLVAAEGESKSDKMDRLSFWVEWIRRRYI